MSDREVSFTLRIKDAASAALKQVEQAANGVSEKLFSFKDILKDLAMAAGAFSLAEVVKSMVELGITADKTFRQIAANLPTFTDGIGKLKEEIADLADVSGRSIEGMEQSAAAIAKLGVSSAEELAQQLRAATMLADATGASVDETAQLLIGLRREYNLTGEQALETAAKLASVSQGKFAITEVAEAFQASAPVFKRLNIDLDTSTRAIAAMVAQNYSSRAIRGTIAGLDADGIRQWAAQATIAADAMGQLTQRSDEYRASLDATNQRVKNEFTKTLSDVAGAMLKVAKPGIETFTNYLKLVKEAITTDPSKLLTILNAIGDVTNGDTRGFSAINSMMGGTTGKTIGAPVFTSIQAPGPKSTAPLSAAEKKAAEDAALAEQKLNLELQKTADAEVDATRKAKDLAKAQGQDLKIAIEQALGAASGQVAQAAAQAIDDRAAKLVREIVLNNEITTATKERMLAEVEATRQIQQAQNAAAPILDRGTLTLASIGSPGHTTQGDLTALMAQEQALRDVDRQILAVHGDDSKEQAQLLEIEKKRAGILSGMVTDSAAVSATITKTTEEENRQTLELAEAWFSVGRSIIQAGQAIGDMDAKTAAMLNSVVNLGEGIVQLFKGNVIAGIAETATSLASLVAGLFSHRDDPEAKALIQAHIEAMKSLTDALYTIIQKGIVPGGASLDEAQQAATIIQNMLAQHVGASGSTQIAAGFLDVNVLQEVAKQFGVTIDSSIDGWKNFLAVLSAGIPILQAAADAAAAAFDEQQTENREDYHVRYLHATGQDQQADDEAFDEQQQREYEAAAKQAGMTIEDFAKTENGIALTMTQAAEKRKRADDAAAAAATAAAAAATALAESIAAADAKMAAAAANVDDIWDVHPTSPTDKILQQAKASGIVLPDDADLSTQSGRDALLERLTAAFDIQGDTDWQHKYRQIIDMVRDLGSGAAGVGSIGAGAFGNPATASIANAFTGITAQDGMRLADINTRMLDATLGMALDVHDIRNMMSMRAPAGFAMSFAPVNVGGSVKGLLADAGPSGPITINLGGIQVAGVSGDPQTTGTELADAFVRELEIKLGRKLNVQQTYKGSITVTPS